MFCIPMLAALKSHQGSVVWVLMWESMASLLALKDSGHQAEEFLLALSFSLTHGADPVHPIQPPNNQDLLTKLIT
jgi:hypothetical protein